MSPPEAPLTGRTRAVLLGGAGLVTGAALALATLLATLPDVRPLAREMPERTAFIDQYRDRERAMGRSAPVAWTPVAATRIDARLALAVLVSEDIGFFGHGGFAFGDMRDAIREALRSGQAPRGASTISQQLAKNLWLSPSRNPLRKLTEALLTRRLERNLSKERILELYLNVAEFGPGIYGAEAAARSYFGKPASVLDSHEAALLAASLSRPSIWHPGSSSAAYARQVVKVEARMARAAALRRRLGLPPADTSGPAPDTLVSGDSLWSAPGAVPPDRRLPNAPTAPGEPG